MRPSTSLARASVAISLVATATGCLPSAESHVVRGSGGSADMKGVLELLPEFQPSSARVKIELESVPPPSRLDAGARVFVVWARRGAAVAPLGTLTLDAGRGAARFEKVVVNGPFELLVTAEPSPDVRVPSPRVLLARQMSGVSND